MAKQKGREEASGPNQTKATAPSATEERQATAPDSPRRVWAPAAPAGPSTAVVAAGRRPGGLSVSRRSILRLGFWSGLGAILAGAAAAGVDLLYPRKVGSFGGKISVSKDEVPRPGEKSVIVRGRFWLTNLTAEQGGPGLLALWWKCTHLGCTVPWREQFAWPDAAGAPKTGWFRCPCHGSTYTDAGILVYGPAPRPLDTMELVVEGGRISVDTGKITRGASDNPQRAVRI
jgi:cytochrome b6-f complex iron-sulfur subunit